MPASLLPTLPSPGAAVDTRSTRAVPAIMASVVLCLAACGDAPPPEDAAPSLAVTPPMRAFAGLTRLPGHHANVWFSEGHQARTEEMARRVDRVMEWFAPRLGMAPSVSLLVLSAQDWPAHTGFPVYGMPHFTDDSLLVVAAEDNEFWRSLVPPLDALPPELAAAVQGAYADGSGGLTLGSFFDLLAIHELGHAYHVQGGLRIQRPSMGELFTNVLLHTYVAEVEPEMLPVLTAFPRSVVALGTSGLRYTSLADLEARYEEIGQQHPQNYAWYQCRWHTAAGEIYDAGGPEVIVRLWTALRDEQELLDDERFLAMLDGQVHPSVAAMYRDWDG